MRPIDASRCSFILIATTLPTLAMPALVCLVVLYSSVVALAFRMIAADVSLWVVAAFAIGVISIEIRMASAAQPLRGSGRHRRKVSRLSD